MNIENLKDWRWRLNHCYPIVDKQGKRQLFQENHIQKILNNISGKRKYILKYRQGGVTTNEVLKQLDHVIFNENINACMLAHEDKGVKKIFEIVKTAHRYMDPRIRPELGRGGGSMYEMRFPETNSKIYCCLESRGDTIHWLHISEAAFANPDRVKATLETVPTDGIVTFETTPNGMGNDFYRRWISKSTRYKKCFFPWFFHPEYTIDPPRNLKLTQDEIEFCAMVQAKYKIIITKGQIAFRRAKQEDLKELYIQEYPEDDVSCFLASGNAAMDLILVKDLLDKSQDPIIDEDTLKIWEKYIKDEEYVIGADCAEGVRKDYSVASVFRVSTREQVAQIRSNTWKPFEFANQIESLATLYHAGGRSWPLVSVELNNHGHAVNAHLYETLGYPNMYEYREGTQGWRTDSITRPVMVDTFIDGVENGTIKINSRDTLGECLTLIDNKGKIEAEEGEHDDCIIADSIAIQMLLKETVSTLYDNLHQKIRL